MDEKDQKDLTIGDILDQLVKPSVTQTPATPPIQPREEKIVPKISVPTEISLPRLGNSGAPIASSAGGSGASPSEQKLLVRTMASDLAMLGKGSKPASVELKTKKTPSQPEEITPKEPEPKVPPPRKEILTPVSPPPPRAMPQLPPVRSLPFQNPRPSKPVSLPKEITENLHIKEEIHIPHEDEDLLPPFPGAPIPKKVTKPQDEKVEYGVIARVVSSGMTTGIISTVVVAILAYVLLSFFFFNNNQTTTPTVSVEPTSTPEQGINELETIFKAFPAVSLSLSTGPAGISEIRDLVGKETIIKKEFKRLSLSSPTQERMGFLQILEHLNISFPASLRDWLGSNSIVLLYGQEEFFDGNGQPSAKRLVLITEVKDESAAKNILRNWEVTIASDLSGLFDIDPAKQATPGFLDNNRREVQIRYKNFPFPDKTVDYAIVRSLSGRNYLILSNSREAMYSPADKIRGI